MASIAIAHTDLMAKGGAEGVCVNTLEALQNDYDVTLVTHTEPDLIELNSFYNTDITGVGVQATPRLSELLDRVDDPLYNLRLALLNRIVGRHEDEFDLVVGTDNELSLDTQCIQYVHTPRFGRLVTTKRVGEDSFVDHLYDRLSYIVGGYDAEQIQASQVLTNSQFMANIVQDTYGVRPRVVPPPVDTTGLRDTPWAEREDGFLTIGRLAAYKNVETTIEIVDSVRERGHDIHQHIVGPPYDHEYSERIRTLANDRDYVHLDGELTRDELLRYISTHRYGLHGKRNEHFGMVVAEIAGGGAIPFVPDNGGQREIVEGNDQRYATPEEAVEKIDAVLSDPERQRELRTTRHEIEQRYGRDRFQETMREIVDSALDETDA